MEKLSKMFSALMMLAVVTNGDDIMEERFTEDLSLLGDLFAKPVIHVTHPTIISHSSPHPPPHSHPSPQSHPPSTPSHPPSTASHPPSSSSSTCNTFPTCNAVNSSCCECKQDMRKCCVNGVSSTSEGYCFADKCASCSPLGTGCYHSNQCCGTTGSNPPKCENFGCCLPEGRTGCSDDDECCQPDKMPYMGTRCKTSSGIGTCVPCYRDYQSCTTDSDCCGESICGNNINFATDYTFINICCLPPGESCVVGLSSCCDTRDCPQSASKRYHCKPDPIGTKKIMKNSKGWGWTSASSGWGSSGWGSSGWASGSNGNGPSLSGYSSAGLLATYPTGECTLCETDSSCVYETDCCTGYTCEAAKCKPILSVKLTIQTRTANDEPNQDLNS